MNSITATAAGALRAFTTGQQITANNIANLSSEGFTATRASFQEGRTSGVTAVASQTEDPVDISREAVNLLSNSRNFTANISVIKSANEMIRELISIKA